MKKLTLVSLASAIALSASTSNDTLAKQVEALKVQVGELQNKQEVILDEMSGTSDDTAAGESFTQMGIAASKVYGSQTALSIGGYGEMQYRNASNANPVVDAYRFVTYIGYKFSDSIIMNTELEWEHGGKESDGGYSVTEFSYFDFLFTDVFNVRAGLMLVPMGLVNLKHEPTLFLGVNRPETEKYIIPSTWRHNGLMAFGDINENISYQFGITDSLNGDKIKDGIRKARQGAINKNSVNSSFVGRLDYDDHEIGLNIGASFLTGKLNPDGTDTVVDAEDESITMYEVHTIYKASGVDFKALYTNATISNEDKFGYSGATGYYATLGYDIMPLIGSSEKELVPFIRYENYDKQVTSTNDSITNTVIGVNYRPVSNVVIKADFMTKTQKSVDDVTVVELGLGYLF